MEKFRVGTFNSSYDCSNNIIAIEGLNAVLQYSMLDLIFNQTQNVLYYLPVPGKGYVNRVYYDASYAVNIIDICTNAVTPWVNIDPCDNLIIQLQLENFGYDITTNVNRTINLSRPEISAADILINQSNIPATTYYLPSTEGLILTGKNPSFQLKIICSSSNTLICNASTWFERCDESDAVTPSKWYKCTELGVISSYGEISNASTYTIKSTNFNSFVINSSQSFEATIDFENFRGYRIRQALIIDGSSRNFVYSSVMQQPIEG